MLRAGRTPAVGLTGLVTEGGQWRCWTRVGLLRYLEVFGINVQFVERDRVPGDVETVAFTQNMHILDKLEGGIMQHLSQMAESAPVQ